MSAAIIWEINVMSSWVNTHHLIYRSVWMETLWITAEKGSNGHILKTQLENLLSSSLAFLKI